MRWVAAKSTIALAFTFVILTAACAQADDSARSRLASSAPPLTSNESLIAAALASPDALAISAPKAVFAYVLAQLPPRVKVYPTENYYYFSFVAGGVSYAGNIRLDARDRDRGKLHFAYFRERTPWMSTSPVLHLDLDAADGVTVEKVEPLVYRVTSGAASVVFALNDLSGVRPPAGALIVGEQYLGPVFDESGVRFFLVFNPRAKVFHYVLDEAPPLGDRLAQIGPSDRISVGMRTGFAFYQDRRSARKILIGVYAENVALNNYYDGPFDQLPDNFIEGDSLRDAILAVQPKLAGKIGRLGHYRDRNGRYVIAPYIAYRSIADFAPVADCAARHEGRSAAYAACFAIGAVDTGQ